MGEAVGIDEHTVLPLTILPEIDILEEAPPVGDLELVRHAEDNCIALIDSRPQVCRRRQMQRDRVVLQDGLVTRLHIREGIEEGADTITRDDVLTVSCLHGRAFERLSCRVKEPLMESAAIV